jgi:hypothetical protein
MDFEKRNYKGHYGLHWIAIALLLALPATYRWSSTHSIVAPDWLPSRTAAPAPASRVNWFFIIKLPEITTQHESGVDTMKTRMTEWLTTLKGAGFHPMLLSEALQRLERGQWLPERTIVTVFNPGYRRTYQIVKPILAQLEWPAVWLTDQEAMDLSDRRLVTYHTTREMQGSGLWDIGYTLRNGRIRLESDRYGTYKIGDAASRPWATAGGAFALNRGAVKHGMNFLTVNSAWMAPELLNRLLVETPPAGNRVFLSKGIIQGREWGLTIPSDQTQMAPLFDIKAPLNRRGTKLFFLGTQGQSNFKLHAESTYLVGEFWLQLRVDDAEGYAINVIYADKAVFVVQQVQREKTRMFFGPHAAPKRGKGFSADLTLQGQQLQVSFNKGKPLLVDGLKEAVPGRGVLQVYIADKPHGTARADAVDLEFTPL